MCKKALRGESFLGRMGVPEKVWVWSTGLLYTQNFPGIAVVWYICLVNVATFIAAAAAAAAAAVGVGLH